MKPETVEAELVPNADMQISFGGPSELAAVINAARQYPRNIDLVVQTIRREALRDPETAEIMSYTIPRREKDKKTGQYATKMIPGPSVRLAEVCFKAYRNLYIATGTVRKDSKSCTVRSVGIDLETLTMRAADLTVSLLQDDNRTPVLPHIAISLENGAIAKAERNVVFKLVPRGVYWPVLMESMEVAAKKDSRKNLQERQALCVDSFKRSFGVTAEQVLAVIGKRSMSEMDEADLVNLRSIYQALAEKEATVEEIFQFPSTGEEREDKPRSAKDVLTQARKRGRPRKMPEPPKDEDDDEFEDTEKEEQS